MRYKEHEKERTLGVMVQRRDHLDFGIMDHLDFRNHGSPRLLLAKSIGNKDNSEQPPIPRLNL